MVVSVGIGVEFHVSDDLIHWRRAGAFGAGHGAQDGAWECPDLFPMEIDGTTESRWVLSVSTHLRGTGWWKRDAYFVGTFDGRIFINENDPPLTLWQDYGPDYYAGVTWRDGPFPDDRRLNVRLDGQLAVQGSRADGTVHRAAASRPGAESEPDA
jgi:fructan beta-fructosidase